MKLKKIFIILTAMITLGTATVYAVNSTHTVDAKVNKATFPKKMRGNWYQYSDYSKKVNKQVITKKHFKMNDDGYKYTRYLHVNPTGQAHDYYNGNKKKLNWIFITSNVRAHGRTWLATRGWYESAGAGAFLNVSKLNGHKVLTWAGGAGVWGSEHWYRSRKLAKRLRNQRYTGFKY